MLPASKRSGEVLRAEKALEQVGGDMIVLNVSKYHFKVTMVKIICVYTTLEKKDFFSFFFSHGNLDFWLYMKTGQIGLYQTHLTAVNSFFKFPPEI